MEETKEENKLVKQDSGFFSKIKRFFKNIFSKEKNYNNSNVEAENNNEENNEKDSFRESLKVISPEEDPELLLLQKKLRAGEIKIEDLSDEQEDKLIELYDRQIKIKKQRIEELRNEIKAQKKVS